MNGTNEVGISSAIKNHDLLSGIIRWYENNNMDTIVIVWDHSDKVVHRSKLLADFINDKSDLNQLWFNYFPYKNVQKIIEHFNTSSEKLVFPNINYTSTANKEAIVHDFKCTVDQFVLNEEVYFICLLQDITDFNHLKNVILDSEKLLSAAEFSAGLVHEIRNPLTSLKGFIQLVQAGVKQQEKYYQVMIDEVEKLEKITSELLHMAKPFSNKLTIVSIENIIEDVLFLMKSQVVMKDINITLNLEGNLQIKCNPSQIKQIFINLIKNGSEAMKMKGNLEINSYSQRNIAVIEVIDQGEGIPEDKIKELNKPFYTTKSDGTGLGLMITQHILECHQGELEVISELNKKTTFRVKLLISKEE